MTGYRNLVIALAALGTSAWLILAGVEHGTDMASLALAIGAKDAAATGAIVARGYNKRVEANGKAAPKE